MTFMLKEDALFYISTVFKHTCQGSQILSVLMMLQFVAMKIIRVWQAMYSDCLLLIRPMDSDRLFYCI